MHFVVFIRFLDTKPRLIRTLSVPHQLWKVQEHICRSYGIGLIDVLHTFRLTRSNKKVQPLLCLRQMGNRIGSNISLGPAFKRHIEGNHNLCYKIPNTTIISKHWGGGIAGIHLPSMPFTDTPPPSKNPTACISNQYCTYIFVITPHWIKIWLQQCNAMKQTHWMCFHKCSNLTAKYCCQHL